MLTGPLEDHWNFDEFAVSHSEEPKSDCDQSERACSRAEDWAIPLMKFLHCKPMRFLAVLALLATSLIVAPQAHADTCPALRIAITPSTGESTPQDDPRQITGLSRGRNFVREVAEMPGVDAWQTPYADTAGMVTGVSESGASEVLPYGASRAQGEQTLRRHLQSFQSACPGSMLALVGFSQGAHITGNIALELEPARVAGVYLISDPMRSPSNGERTVAGAWLPATNKGTPTPNTHGVVGFRKPGAFEGLNVVQICADSDPVCSISANDPVVELAQSQNAKVDAPAYRQHEAGDLIGGAKLLAGEM